MHFLLRRQTSAHLLLIVLVLIIGSSAMMQLTGIGPVVEYPVLDLGDWDQTLAIISLVMLAVWLIPSFRHIGLIGLSVLLIASIFHHRQVSDPVAYQTTLLLTLWLTGVLRGLRPTFLKQFNNN